MCLFSEAVFNTFLITTFKGITVAIPKCLLRLQKKSVDALVPAVKNQAMLGCANSRRKNPPDGVERAEFYKITAILVY